MKKNFLLGLFIASVIAFSSSLSAQRYTEPTKAKEILEQATDQMNAEMAELEEPQALGIVSMELKLKAYESMIKDLNDHFSISDCIQRAVIKCGDGKFDEEDYRANRMDESYILLQAHLQKMLANKTTK